MSDLQGEDSEIYWERTTRAIEQLTTLDGVIDEDPQLSALQVSARAKREHRKKPLRLVVVDHLHEMALPGKQGEVIERGQALRDLKALAKYLKCPVVVLAQLNRDGGDDGKRPQLKHLRGSGGIEEVADLVLLVHRPDYYNPNDRPGLVEVVVAKGRNVKTGSVIALQNRFDIMRADDWEGPEPEPLGQASQPSQQRPARQRRPLGQPMGRSRANGFQGDDA
jgi:replicative DNA helicase